MTKKSSRPLKKRSSAWLGENREGRTADDERVKHGTFAQHLTQAYGREIDRSRNSRRFRVVKIKDHSDHKYSWIVFDTAATDRSGEYVYIADCINAKSARVVADALNAFVSNGQ
jgi:hypothetical protein